MKKWTAITLSTLFIGMTAAFVACGGGDSSTEKTGGVTYTKNAAGTAYSVTGFELDGDTVTIAAEYEGLPVTKIAKGAFNAATTDSEDIKEIVIPVSVTQLESGAFSGCDKLEKVSYEGTVAQWLAIQMYNNDDAAGVDENPFVASDNKAALYAKGEKVTSVTLTAARAGVNIKGCASVTSVTLADTVTKIAAAAFANCTELTSVVIGTGVTFIGAGAFEGCDKLTGVEFKDANGWGLETTGAGNRLSFDAEDIDGADEAAELLLDETYYGVWTKIA